MEQSSRWPCNAWLSVTSSDIPVLSTAWPSAAAAVDAAAEVAARCDPPAGDEEEEEDTRLRLAKSWPGSALLLRLRAAADAVADSDPETENKSTPSPSESASPPQALSESAAERALAVATRRDAVTVSQPCAMLEMAAKLSASRTACEALTG